MIFVTAKIMVDASEKKLTNDHIACTFDSVDLKNKTVATAKRKEEKRKREKHR